MADIIRAERRQHDFLHPSSGATDRGQCPHQWMRRTDFVVAISSDQQHVMHVPIGDQAFQQFQSRSSTSASIVAVLPGPAMGYPAVGRGKGKF